MKKTAYHFYENVIRPADGRLFEFWPGCERLCYTLVMSIGNQKFGIPRKYQYQIGIWYFCPNFLGIFLVFYRYFEKTLVKIWFKYWYFGRIKIVWYLVSVVAISLVSVWFRFEIF